EAVRVHGQLLRQLALAEHLHGNALARGEARTLEGVRRDLGSVVEAGVEVAQVHRLGLGAAELLERHRLLHVRPAQLAHPHVDRHLAALGVRAALGAGPRACALLTAPARLSDARALAAADALAPVAGPRRGLQRVQADLRHRQLLRDGARHGSLRAQWDRLAARRYGR